MNRSGSDFTVVCMEKTTKNTVAMSESPSLTALTALLAMRTQIPGTVTPEIQLKINNLKGILDTKTLTSARNGGDWRRGTAGSTSTQSSSYGSGLDSRWRNSHNNLRTAATNMKNSPSNQSLGASSTGSTGSPTSPGSAKQTTYTGPPVGRYVSRFRNQTEQLEEKILNRIIRLKLNKFGATTYTEIRDFLFQILGQESIVTEESGETVKAEEGQVEEFVRDFMRMVFRKAAAEQIYCPLYAKLLAEIGEKHSVIFAELNSLYDNYMEIFEEADVNTSTSTEDKESFEKKCIDKKYRQGYSQFIAELTTLEILSVEALASTFHTLFFQIEKHSKFPDRKPLVDEYVDCALRMSRVLKEKHSDFFRNARAKLYGENKELLITLINIRDSTYPSLSPKSRFLLMDIQDILALH